jgi:DNA processing protein
MRRRDTAPGPTDTPPMPMDLTPDEVRVLGLVPSEEAHIEAIIYASQLPAQAVASILLTLELRGLVRQFPGTFFARC